MTWRVANSLNVLLRQVNAAFPNRDKSSDGSIGDESHASRSSDHNPWVKDGGEGVVTARDITNDAPYMDSHQLALALVASRDERIKYIIDHGMICSGTDQENTAWKWRPYSGKNDHSHHVHISVKPQKKYYDDETPWQKATMNSAPPPAAAAVTSPLIPKPNKYPVLRLKSIGVEVARLQTLLNAKQPTIKILVDGEFGPGTEKSVKAFQNSKSLVADGVVGPYTWKALEA